MKFLVVACLAASAHAAPLQWDACAWGQSASGSTCTGAPAALTWQQALQAASQANAALHQGQADWRVPNRTELESTVDLSAPGAGAFWSSTSYHPAPARAWTVDFGDGATSPADKTAALALRLVRGGDAYQLPGPAATPALSLPGSPGQTAQATVAGGGGTCTFTSARFVSAAGLPAAPAHVTLAADPFEFILDGCTPGGTVQVTITYPQPLPAGAQFWKHGPRPGQAASWYAYPHAAISGSTVVLTLTDGALGDDDLDATNGRIVDAGAPAAMAMPAGGVEAIPTLSQWGVLLLSGLLGLAALRRRA
ncbi:DUF1566 domain-containing protein [Ottowia sp.]|uniref:Lcl C-terminal domain-containing protein n=1 Tax=Ottowia sp. TaxID=1898956 RepID=UPI0039E657B9